MTALRTWRTAMFLAARALTRGAVGVLAMTVAMMALVFVQLLFIPALIEGAIDQVEDQLVETSTANIQVTPPDGASTISDPEAVADDLAAVDGVAAVSPQRRVASEVTHGSTGGSWPVQAVDPDAYADVFATESNLIEGEWLDPGDTDGIVLGIGVAGAGLEDVSSYRSSLRTVHTGDTVSVTFANGSTSDLTVVGIYRNRFASSDAQALISQAAADAHAPALASTASIIHVRTDERGDEGRVVEALREAQPNLDYETWQDQLQAIDEQVKSFDLIKQILRVVSLLIAAVTIVIVTYIDLVSKRRTIGIERAIGIRGDAVVTSYVLKAIAFALAGVAVGLALMFSAIVPLIEDHPFSFPNGPVTLSLDARQLRTDAVVLVAVAVVSALAPAIRSVRIPLLTAIWR